MRIQTASFLSMMLIAGDAAAAVRVSPTGVNVNAQGTTTVLLTFGGLEGYTAAEGVWCGELVPATPDIGQRCDPPTLLGTLPARYDWLRPSGRDALTDIMSIPPSVARRAYQAAVAGRSAEFFYVRRFVRAGSPDQYVAVTCRLTGGGARTPLSLVDVQVAFDVDTPVLQVPTGERPPALSARLQYTGTGRLVGRWEIVLPGQELPGEADLLTEATLPLEARGTQRRYAAVERFNVFLPPGGRYTLRGPDPSRLPTAVDGSYLVLLRVEASDDKEADSDLGAVGAGQGVVHAGAGAGFPMPVLQYVVGSGGSENAPATGRAIGDLTPPDRASVPADARVELGWRPRPRTVYYRIDVESGGQRIHQAFVNGDQAVYRLPPFVRDKIVASNLRWRVAALDASGRDVATSDWSTLTFRP